MNLRLKKAPLSLYEIAGVLMMLRGVEERGGVVRSHTKPTGLLAGHNYSIHQNMGPSNYSGLLCWCVEWSGFFESIFTG